MCLNSLYGVSIDELALGAALAVCFDNVDVFDVVLGAEDGFLLDWANGVDNQIAEEVEICVDQFAWHRCFGTVQKGLLS